MHPNAFFQYRYSLSLSLSPYLVRTKCECENHTGFLSKKNIKMKMNKDPNFILITEVKVG